MIRSLARYVALYVLVPVSIILLACASADIQSRPDPTECTFTNPLLDRAPDPWVAQKGDWYYVTHTTGRNLRLYRTKSMSDLRNAEMKTVWTAPATGMNSKQIWAPEIHFIQGKWYFYYAADDGHNENHRMWVLENAAEDPFTGNWVDRGELELPGDKWAIDGTVFEHNGQLYFMWSGWEGDVNVSQNIYIVKMKNPYTAEGERILLSTAEYGWERKGGTPLVNEGPQYLAREDKMFVIYSASGCWTDDYALGMLTAPATADPLDASSWTKFPEPVFVKDTAAATFGPGHNSFFTSPDGTEDWIFYHANPLAGKGCGGDRSARMQKFHWTEDGFPDFGKPVAPGVALNVPSGEE